MADNDQPSRLEAATIKAEAGSQIVSDFANLPADQTVATASGNIPTLAGVIGTIQDEGDQAAADVRAKADAQVQAAIGTLVKKSGDTMTGLLTLSGPPTANLHAATKKYADDGDAATLASSKTYTDQKIASAPMAFYKYFESPSTSFGQASLLSFSHGLGARPKIAGVSLVCTVANNGWAVGDIIDVSPYLFGANNALVFICYYDSTTINLKFNAAAQSLTGYLLNKSTGVGVTVQLNNFFNAMVRASA